MRLERRRQEEHSGPHRLRPGSGKVRRPPSGRRGGGGRPGRRRRLDSGGDCCLTLPKADWRSCANQRWAAKGRAGTPLPAVGHWRRKQRGTTIVRRAGDCPPYLLVLREAGPNFTEETRSAAALLCFLAMESRISPCLKLGTSAAPRISATRMRREQPNQPLRKGSQHRIRCIGHGMFRGSYRVHVPPVLFVPSEARRRKGHFSFCILHSPAPGAQGCTAR